MNNVMRHTYKELNAIEKGQMENVKTLGLEFYTLISLLEPSREVSLALTKIEEAVMWATKHITK